MIGREVVDRADPDAAHRGVNAASDDIEHVLDAGGAVGGKAPQVRPADEDRVGAKAQGLHDIGTTADTTVHHDLDVVADRCGDLGQHPDRGRRRVDIVSAMVGNRDGGDADVDGPPGFVGPDDALDHELAVPLRAQPGHVLPGRRGVIIQAP